MPDEIEFNPLDPDFRRDPFEGYARGREIGGGRHSALPVPLFSIFRYDDIQQTLRDHETFSNAFPTSPAVAEALDGEPPPSMLGSDPPRHDRLRGLVNSAFTPRIIQRLRPRMVELAHQLVDDALEEGEVDLVEALSYPLPVVIIAEIIGVPARPRTVQEMVRPGRRQPRRGLARRGQPRARQSTTSGPRGAARLLRTARRGAPAARASSRRE